LAPLEGSPDERGFLSECGAGYRRIELDHHKGSKGEFRCLFCDRLLEVFDGSTEIAIRLTVQPEKGFH
jgi:hypothetical protein